MNDNRTPTCECGNPKNRRAVGCQRCMDLDYDRISGETRRKVLTKLRQLDEWVSAQEVYVALDVAGEVDCRPYGDMLRQLAREGELETRGLNSGKEYRLVQRKRRAA